MAGLVNNVFRLYRLVENLFQRFTSANRIHELGLRTRKTASNVCKACGTIDLEYVAFLSGCSTTIPDLTYNSTTKHFRVIVEGQAIHVEGPDDGIKTLIASY